MPDREIPEDFSLFVTTYGPRLTAACRDFAGNDRIAEAMRVDMLAAVALSWRWRPARWRGRHALSRLDRLLYREARGYRVLPAADRRTLMSAETQERVRPLEEKEIVALADAAWRRARALRRQGLLSLAAAAMVVLVLVLIGPREVPLPQPAPEPTATPDDVVVLPSFRELADMVQGGRSPLPTGLDLGPGPVATLPPLAAAPLQRAIAVVEPNLGRLVVLGADGNLRRVDDRALASARLVSTSLSPAGRLIALPTGADLLVVDVWSGAVRLVPVGAAQPTVPTVVWRTGDSVLVPGEGGALEVNLLTGEVSTIERISGSDVVSVQGIPGSLLIEMVSGASLASQRSRIRFWRTPPAAVPVVTTPSAGPPASPGQPPSPSPPPEAGRFDERPVSGPAWIGDWRGPAWSSTLLYVRACSPETVQLPHDEGVARAVIGALQPNGRSAGTLVAVDNSELDVLGFVRAQELLVLVTKGGDAALVGWTPIDEEFVVVATYAGVVRMSVADLLRPS